MKYVKTFQSFGDYQYIAEKDGKDKEKGKEESGKGESEEEEAEDSAFKGKTPEAKEMDIDGTKYTAIPSTFKAISFKQKDMGEEAVGVITLPGSSEIYELMKVAKQEKSEEKK
jgi:hypothetical protein